MIRFILIMAAFLVMAMPVFTPAHAGDVGLDFRTVTGQDAWKFLASKNFVFERGANDRNETNLQLTEKGLVIEALDTTQSIIVMKKGHLENYRDVLIKWGVDKFPKGASYANGKRNEAIMLYAVFGSEMIDSGGLVVPDLPYFIALHLCENDEINKPEKGRFYHKGGRFVCVAKPKPGELVTTRFNLKKAFKEYYGFDAPPLHAVAFEFDTKGAPDGGKTSAFIQEISFPDAVYNRED